MAKISGETKAALVKEYKAFKRWLKSRLPVRPFQKNQYYDITDPIDRLLLLGKYDEVVDTLSNEPFYQGWIDEGRQEFYISPEEEAAEERVKEFLPPELFPPTEPTPPEPLDPLVQGMIDDLGIKVHRDPSTGEIFGYTFGGQSWTDPQEAIAEVNKILEQRAQPEETLEYGDITELAYGGINFVGQYDQYGRFHSLGQTQAPSGVAALSPQDQALATMGIFKNESGQFVDEFGMVLGNTPDEARARYQQKQEFEKYLSERLSPVQQEQFALQREQMRLSQKPSLGEITQASIMEKQAWMSPFAAPVPWATRWSARAGGEFTPKAQAPQIQSPVQSWARQ